MNAADTPALTSLLELVQLLQMHREASSRFLAGDSSAASSRAQIAMWIAQQLSLRLPPPHRGLMSNAWRLLVRVVRRRAVTEYDCDALHVALIRRYLRVAERLSEAEAAQDLAVAIDGVRESLLAGKLAIEAQIGACYRALSQQRHAAV